MLRGSLHFMTHIPQNFQKIKMGAIPICEICRKKPCDSRCPNAPEPPAVCECYLCGEPIREGDYFYRLGELKYCEECVEDSREEAEFSYGLD